MSDPKKPTYDIGYGKPPPQSRFQAGQSGNPKGRPKGARNFSTVIDQELNARVPVKENGKRKVISKRQAVVKQLINKAVSGDMKAIQPLIGIASQNERQALADVAGGGAEILATPEDAMVMESILQRVRAAAGLPPTPESTEGIQVQEAVPEQPEDAAIDPLAEGESQ